MCDVHILKLVGQKKSTSLVERAQLKQKTLKNSVPSLLETPQPLFTIYRGIGVANSSCRFGPDPPWEKPFIRNRGGQSITVLLEIVYARERKYTWWFKSDWSAFEDKQRLARHEHQPKTCYFDSIDLKRKDFFIITFALSLADSPWADCFYILKTNSHLAQDNQNLYPCQFARSRLVPTALVVSSFRIVSECWENVDLHIKPVHPCPWVCAWARHSWKTYIDSSALPERHIDST